MLSRERARSGSPAERPHANLPTVAGNDSPIGSSGSFRARKTNVVLGHASTVLPPPQLLSELGNMNTGTYAFVGRVSLEAEILDSIPGERLIVAVDERAGSKRLRGSTNAWSHVHSAFDYWADVVRAPDRHASVRRHPRVTRTNPRAVTLVAPLPERIFHLAAEASLSSSSTA